MRKPPRARPGEINHGWVDRFTLAHLAIGAVYGWLDLHVLVALGLACVWELVEDLLKAYVPAIFPHATRDTWANAVGDVVAVMAGWGVVRGWAAL